MSYDAAKTFEQFAPTYLKMREQGFDNRAQLVELADELGGVNGKAVLELGCGGARPVLSFFAEQGAQVFGVDFSPTMIAAASANVPNGKFVCADMCAVDLPQEHFHLALAFYSLFVLTLPEQFRVFQLLYDSLRSNGLAFFCLSSKAATKHDEFSDFLEFAGHKFFFSHTTPDKYATELRRIGFDILSLEELEIGGEPLLWVKVRKG